MAFSGKTLGWIEIGEATLTLWDTAVVKEKVLLLPKRIARFGPKHSVILISKLIFLSVVHYMWFSQFWSHFHGTNALFASKAKINIVWNFFKRRVPEGYPEWEKISNNVDFSLWGNRATTWEYFLTFSSETKIMKFRYSAQDLCPEIWG